MKEEKSKFPATELSVCCDLVNIGVSVIIFNQKQQVLLYQRKDLGWWGFPGGRVDNKESLEFAALREVKEETGLKVVLKNVSGIYLKTKGKKNILFIFTAEVDGGKLLKTGDETKNNRWFQIKKAQTLLSPNLRRRLKDALRKDHLFIRRQDALPFKMWLDLRKRDLRNFISFR